MTFFCEQGKQILGSIKFKKFLNKLIGYKLFNNNSFLCYLLEDNNYLIVC
jgi:hypothetical protein